MAQHHALPPMFWPSPPSVFVATPLEVDFLTNPYKLSLADALPDQEEHAGAVLREAAAGSREQNGVAVPRARTGSRVQARHLRYLLNCRLREGHRNTFQGSANPRSSCDRLDRGAARMEPPSQETADKNSLRTHFDELDGVPRERIFLVRKIQQLGMGSADVIRAHFNVYGDVLDVLVAHSPVLSGCKSYVRRLRPSNLAIVVMADAATVERVHSEGSCHVINGASVSVEHYKRLDNRRGQADIKQEAELDVSTFIALGCSKESCDAGSTIDEGSSHRGDASSEISAEDACISGPFEYWATDDESEW